MDPNAPSEEGSNPFGPATLPPENPRFAGIWLQEAPAWLVSLLFHISLVLVLSLLGIQQAVLSKPQVLTCTVASELPALDAALTESLSQELELAADEAVAALNVDVPLAEQAPADIHQILSSQFAQEESELPDTSVRPRGRMSNSAISRALGLAPIAGEEGLPQGLLGDFRAMNGRLKQAGAQGGALQFSLSWDGYNDLDLHVLTPAKDEIWYSMRQSQCGGTLDVDANGGGPNTDTPVENVFWPQKEQAPDGRTHPTGPVQGRYWVVVHYYARHDPTGPRRCKFLLVVRSGDKILAHRADSVPPYGRMRFGPFEANKSE